MDKPGYIRMIKDCKVTHHELNLDGEAGMEGVWKNDTRKYTHTNVAWEEILMWTLNKLKLSPSITFINFLLSNWMHFLCVHRMITKKSFVTICNITSKKVIFKYKTCSPEEMICNKILFWKSWDVWIPDTGPGGLGEI